MATAAAKAATKEVLSPEQPETMSKGEFIETFMINSLGQRQPADAYSQANDLWNALQGMDDLAKRDFVLRCVSANSGKAMAPHTLRAGAEGLWNGIKGTK